MTTSAGRFSRQVREKDDVAKNTNLIVSPKSAKRTAINTHLLLASIPLLAFSWALMWTQDTFWNPLFFLGLWLGATLMMYAIGKDGYPGVRLHSTLMAISVPLWWWFELVNLRTGDWIYILTQDYSPFWYALLSSLAYSTVVPALHAAWRLTIGHAGLSPIGPGSARGRGCITEIVAGASALVALFVFPGIFFPFVWVAPFLILDGVMGYGGGRRLGVCPRNNVLSDMRH